MLGGGQVCALSSYKRAQDWCMCRCSFPGQLCTNSMPMHYRAQAPTGSKQKVVVLVVPNLVRLAVVSVPIHSACIVHFLWCLVVLPLPHCFIRAGNEGEESVQGWSCVSSTFGKRSSVTILHWLFSKLNPHKIESLNGIHLWLVIQ